MMVYPIGRTGRPVQTLTVEAAQDRFDRLSKTKKPVLGLAQLTWRSRPGFPPSGLGGARVVGPTRDDRHQIRHASRSST